MFVVCIFAEEIRGNWQRTMYGHGKLKTSRTGTVFIGRMHTASTKNSDIRFLKSRTSYIVINIQ